MLSNRVYLDDVMVGYGFWGDDPGIYIVFLIAGVTFLIPLFVTYAISFIFAGIGYVRLKPIAGLLGTLCVLTSSSVSICAWLGIIYPALSYDLAPRPFLALLLIILMILSLLIWPVLAYLIIKRRWIMFRGKGAKHTYLTLWSLGMTLWTLANGVVLVGVLIAIAFLIALMHPLMKVETNRGSTLTYYNMSNGSQGLLVESKGWNLLAVEARWVHGADVDEMGKASIKWVEEIQCFRIRTYWDGHHYMSMPGLPVGLIAQEEDVLDTSHHGISGFDVGRAAYAEMNWAPVLDGQGMIILRINPPTNPQRMIHLLIYRPDAQRFVLTDYELSYYYLEMKLNGEFIHLDINNMENQVLWYDGSNYGRVIDQSDSEKWSAFFDSISDQEQESSTQPSSVYDRLQELYPNLNLGQ